MAPERRPLRENQYLFDVGVRGRKTGLTVPDTGVRDENGLEAMDHLFSSPEKPKAAPTNGVNGAHKNGDATISSEEDMDVVDSTIPEPTEVLSQRRQRAGSMRLPPPRSKSPIKTFLQSPARRNPSLGPNSSPVRGSIVKPKTVTTTASVRRKLDFSNSSLEMNGNMSSSSTVQKRSKPVILAKSAQFASDKEESLLLPDAAPEMENAEGQDDTAQDDVGFIDGGDSYQIENGYDDEEPETAPEKDAEDAVEIQEASQKSKKSKEKGGNPEIVKRGRGRPKKAATSVIPEDEDARPAKRSRQSLSGSQRATNKSSQPKKAPAPIEVEASGKESEEEGEEPEEEARPVKRSRKTSDVSAPAKTTSEAKSATSKGVRPKSRGKAKLATIEEADSPAATRGPPMPRNNRGLVMLRSKTPVDSGVTQTRSGRHSIKPLCHWKNEQIEWSGDEVLDGGMKIVLKKMKGVVRVEEAELPVRGRARSKSKAPRSRQRKPTAEPESADEDEDDEIEPWEADPGRIVGEVRSWDPDNDLGTATEEREEEIALSSAAIVTRDIANATFRFAKTLTLPFFGAGMVDLPPGAMKKQKNSRKMQMAFFVFYGRVQVTVNDNAFRIGKGGMWQVPRGNFYSIENDYEKPARIFFSQGCEVEQVLPEADSQA